MPGFGSCQGERLAATHGPVFHGSSGLAMKPQTLGASGEGLPPLFRGRRRWLLTGLLCNHLLQALLAVAVAWQLPALVRQMAAAPVPELAQAPWWPAASLAGASLLALGALRHLSLAQGEALAQHYIAHVRLRLFDRLASLSPAGQQRRSRGGVMLRFVGDVQALRAWIGTGLAQCVAAGFALGALGVGLAWWAPALAAWALGWGVLAGLAMTLTLPRLARTVRLSRQRQAQIAANIHDRINHLQGMQGTGNTRNERRRLSGQNRRLRQALLGRAWAQAAHRSALDLCILGLGSCLLVASVLGLGGTGAQGMGGLLATGVGPGAGTETGLWAGVLGLLGLLSTPLRGLGLALESRAAAQVARERMLDFLAEPQRLHWARSVPPASRGPTRHRKGPALQLEGAGLPGRLAPLTAHLAAGAQLAVLGAPDSGKSSLVALLARLEDPAQGRVLANGQPLARWSQARWRRLASHLSAEPALTRGSVRQFLRQRQPRASDAQLLQACALAGWPQATAADLDHQLPDEGAGLSGQRKRQLALAGALVGQPRLLVIDDAEHSLPFPAEQQLSRLLAEFEGSLVYTTARPELAALAPTRWTLPTAATPATDAPCSPGAAQATADRHLPPVQTAQPGSLRLVAP